MLDIIIPAYNSHKTIKRCLKSIFIQDVDCKITIVNDGGHSYNLNNYLGLNIQELKYGENKGPGYAINYGLDNTESEYVTFIDADDMFNYFALERLLNAIRNENTAFVISDILRETERGSFVQGKFNKGWFHGKMFKRSFIEKYNIRCNENSNCCEDASFNIMALLCLNGKTEKETLLPYNTYYWLYNRESLGRKDSDKWEHSIVPIEYVNNLIYVFDELNKRKIVSGRILIERVVSMIHTLVNYSNNLKYPQYQKENKEAVITCYNKIYKDIEDQVTDNILQFCLKCFKLEGTIEDQVKIVKQMISEIK